MILSVEDLKRLYSRASDYTSPNSSTLDPGFAEMYTRYPSHQELQTAKTKKEIIAYIIANGHRPNYDKRLGVIPNEEGRLAWAMWSLTKSDPEFKKQVNLLCPPTALHYSIAQARILAFIDKMGRLPTSTSQDHEERRLASALSRYTQVDSKHTKFKALIHSMYPPRLDPDRRKRELLEFGRRVQEGDPNYAASKCYRRENATTYDPDFVRAYDLKYPPPDPTAEKKKALLDLGRRITTKDPGYSNFHNFRTKGSSVYDPVWAKLYDETYPQHESKRKSSIDWEKAVEDFLSDSQEKEIGTP